MGKEITVDKKMFILIVGVATVLIVGVAIVLGVFVAMCVPCAGNTAPISAKASSEEIKIEFDRISTNRADIVVLRDRKLGVMYLVNEWYGHGGICVMVDRGGRPLKLRD